MAPNKFTKASRPKNPIQTSGKATEYTEPKGRDDLAGLLGLDPGSNDYPATRVGLRDVVVSPPVVIAYNKFHRGRNNLVSKEQQTARNAAARARVHCPRVNSKVQKESEDEAGATDEKDSRAKVKRAHIEGALQFAMGIVEWKLNLPEYRFGTSFEEAHQNAVSYDDKEEWIAAFLWHAARLFDRYDSYCDLRARRSRGAGLNEHETDQFEALHAQFNDPEIYRELLSHRNSANVPEHLQLQHKRLPVGLRAEAEKMYDETKFERLNRIWQLMWQITADTAPSKWEEFISDSTAKKTSNYANYLPLWWTAPVDEDDAEHLANGQLESIVRQASPVQAYRSVPCSYELRLDGELAENWRLVETQSSIQLPSLTGELSDLEQPGRFASMKSWRNMIRLKVKHEETDTCIDTVFL